MTPRSASLLKSLIARGEFSVERIAQVLDCNPGELESLASAERAMPLTTQLLLAEFVVANVPALARRGHALKGQVTAATSFRDHDTSVHSEPPGRWSMRRK